MTDRIWAGLTCDVNVLGLSGTRRCDVMGMAISKVVTKEGVTIYPVYCVDHDKNRDLYPHFAYPSGFRHQWARVIAYKKSAGEL